MASRSGALAGCIATVVASAGATATVSTGRDRCCGIVATRLEMTRLWLHVANANESTARHRAMASDELVSAHSGLRECAKELSRSRAREITSSILVRRRPLTGQPPGGFQECRSELCVCKCDVIWRRNDLAQFTVAEETQAKHACSESRPVIMEPKDRRDECWHEHHKRLNLRRIPHMQRNQRRDPGRNTRRRRAPPHRHKIHIHTHTHARTHPTDFPRSRRQFSALSRPCPKYYVRCRFKPTLWSQSSPNRALIWKCGLTFGSRYRRARGGCTCPISCRSGRGWSRSA